MGVSSDCIADFFAEGKICRYKSNEIILRPDDNPSGVYYIMDGYIKVYSITENGEEKLHIIYKPDEIFPWIWVFRNKTRQAFYEALGDVTLLRKPKEEFLGFLKNSCNQGKCYPVLFELMDRMTTILNVHDDRVDNLELTKAYPRLVARLLSLAKRFGKQEKGEVILDLPITHKDIASSINMTRETASRELERLEKKGLLKYEGHRLTITDINKLKRELAIHFEKERL